jgi:hypothetical protein
MLIKQHSPNKNNNRSENMANIKCPSCNLTNWATSNSCKRCGYNFQAMNGQNYQPRAGFISPNNPPLHGQQSSNINRYYGSSRRNTIAKPVWVEIGLIGINSRESAVGWLNASIIGSILTACGIIFAGIKIQEASVTASIIAGVLFGGLLSSSSFWYWSCLKWMDENKGWKE